MPNVTKKNVIIKKKLNYCYGFIPGNFQVICGSVVNKNCQLPDSTKTPVFKMTNAKSTQANSHTVVTV